MHNRYICKIANKQIYFLTIHAYFELEPHTFLHLSMIYSIIQFQIQYIWKDDRLTSNTVHIVYFKLSPAPPSPPLLFHTLPRLPQLKTPVRPYICTYIYISYWKTIKWKSAISEYLNGNINCIINSERLSSSIAQFSTRNAEFELRELMMIIYPMIQMPIFAYCVTNLIYQCVPIKQSNASWIEHFSAKT